MFLMLDSYKHPLKTYGDIAYRVFGGWAQHLVSILQSIQLLVNVGLIIIANAQGIYQINPKICTFVTVEMFRSKTNRTTPGFTLAGLIWVATGMATGQIRTLQKLGFLSNFAIWLNLIILFVTMAVVTRTPPNYKFSHVTNNRPKNLTEIIDPVVTSIGIPPFAKDFTSVISGLMQAVFAYGGAMLFTEFLAEMRRPMDFWKAMIIAQSFIYFVYMIFGIVVYAAQGQYTINPAGQGMSSTVAYTAGNIIGFISAVIAATLYGNIGIKVIYSNILQEFFGFPDLSEKSGKLIWAGLVPIYWSLAFVIASAIPNLSDMSAFLAALCIIQFTYTFPPMFMIGAMIQRDAVQAGEGYDPTTGQTSRFDSGMTRWVRGYMKSFLMNTFNVIFCLGSLVTAGLGMYSSIIQIKEKFAEGVQKPFGCKLGS
jgi:Transmembrane amino acid transporter protein